MLYPAVTMIEHFVEERQIVGFPDRELCHRFAMTSTVRSVAKGGFIKKPECRQVKFFDPEVTASSV